MPRIDPPITSAHASAVATVFGNLSWKPISAVVAIAMFAFIVLYSAAGGSVMPWAAKQLAIFAVLLAMAIALSRVPIRYFRNIAFPFYGFFLLLLLLVELFGAVRGGSQRWLNLGVIQLQPSEMMKLAIVLAIARFYDLFPSSRMREIHAIWPALALIGVPAALVMTQPDLGTGLMISLGGLCVMFLAGLPLWLFIGGGVAVAIIAPLAYLFLLHDYQRNRVLIFLNPESDSLGTGYHITQSKIAIGSGGIFGKGFLQGSQSHLDYLPEGQTDFVFATMAEEWGLVGGMLLIATFIFVTRWGLRVAQRAEGKFERLTAAGLSMTIFFYIAINISMVMGLAPVVGIPLPLFSFGSSAQLTVLLALGIIMAIDRNNRIRSNWRLR